ncbi:MAG: prepilin-type cleavage/methylation domain-containing protein [Xanthomonadales bacterium]|nr:prepilin-type cleavage/methylation domain-containing protein [Xanthomonadales bacterium]|tara:strand:+ start:249 stop:677 length:429 start_codon:yes stop_codon:yes gene_type:complete
MMSRSRARTAAGFTLIELLIAIAILAIIMGIAIPSYNIYVLKSGRADATSTLLQTAQTLERCFTRFSAYDDGNCAIQDGATIESENEKYDISVATAATTYDLTAAPKGSQTNDSECGSFTLDETGARGVSAGTEPELIEKCW